MGIQDYDQVDVLTLDRLIHSKECYIQCADDYEFEHMVRALWAMPNHERGFRMDKEWEHLMRKLWRDNIRTWGLRFHFYNDRAHLTCCSGDFPTYDIPEFPMEQFIVSPPEAPMDECDDAELADDALPAELFG